MNPPEINKNNSFTAIRMILCFIVVYEHAIILGHLDFVNFDLRTMAVEGFFCISGFWVTISLLKSNSIKEYFKKEYGRFTPHILQLYLFRLLQDPIFLKWGGTGPIR